MKASELIKKLMDLYLEHGDVDVLRDNAYMDTYDEINPEYDVKVRNDRYHENHKIIVI